MREPRVVRTVENEGRRKALAGARLALKEQLSLSEAAKRSDASRDSVGEAYLLLRYGTEEEITSVENNLLALNIAASAIRLRVPAVERERKSPHKNCEHTHRAELEAAIWAKLRRVLDDINAMPQPADVVAIVRKNQRRAQTLNTKLIAAYGWITEFSDAWTK